MRSARNVLSLTKFAELTRGKKLDRTAPELANVAIRGGASLKIVGDKRDADADDESAAIPFVISCESVDRYDSTLAADGWQLDNYRKNPVVMFAHRTWSDPPIGRSATIGVSNKELRASVEFVPRDVSPFAAMIRAMVVRGFLNAASVSWDPLKWSYAEDRGYYAIDYLEMDLMEWSIVPVPGNPETLAEARAAGVDLDPLAGWAEEHLDSLVGRELSAEDRVRVGRLEAIRRGAGREKLTFVDLAGDFETRLAAAMKRIEDAAASVEARAASLNAGAPPASPTPAPAAIDGDELARAIAKSTRGASREFVRNQTGRLD